ncbi:MAG: alpha/beta hydrolase-fold protein [Kofleriaceae bacterium]
MSNRVLDDADPYASRLAMRAGELATYQVVVPVDAGTPRTERFAFRAIVGISMGGNAAMSIALAHPDRFDVVADLGGEPGPSMRYTLTMVRDYLFGGFCTTADEAAGHGAVGQLCPDQQRPPRTDQFEIKSDFDHMVYQDGEGVGLTLSRSFYMKAARDLARALSNPALYNPEDPYRPPGVSAAYLERPPAERCADPVVLTDFYDREFNPDGSRPVITFCDGNDGPVLGTIDPTVAPTTRRRSCSRSTSTRTAGAIPVSRSSPTPTSRSPTSASTAWPRSTSPATTRSPTPIRPATTTTTSRNPGGTEGNLDWDQGEPFEDVGLDGVDGTCQHGDAPAPGLGGCYDVGEGDGAWTLSPNVARWYESDVATRLAALTPAQRAHVSLWFDAGIRDMLNASISANAGAGVLATYGLPVGVYDGFSPLDGSSSETVYDFARVDWSRVPRYALLRYGNPDATEAQIALGDGRHVGTAAQLVNRATTAFAWIDKRLPDGDRVDETAGGEALRGQLFTAPSTGRETPYAVFLPPGYDQADNADLRYPVVYFLHGYGQEPDDLLALSSVFEVYMQPSSLDLAQRFQKMIIVYVDGRCRPAGDDALPVNPDGDRCERGTFYKDAPGGGPAQMETNLLELMDHIDGLYRTRAAADVEIVP